MGTRQARLLPPSPARLAALSGRVVQLVLTDGQVLRGSLHVRAGIVEISPSFRGSARAIHYADIRELIADEESSR